MSINLPNLRGVAALAALTLLAACGTEKPGDPNQAPATPAQVEGTVHVCSSCHGLDGKSISPTFPRLAGQQAQYLEAQLKAFRDKTRADPHAHTYMWGMAAHLSDPMIAGVAAYYAALTPATGNPGDPAEMAAGRQIFVEGLPERDVPACQACHGEHAEGMETIPRLAGQHRSYLAAQLVNFASNARANEVMHANSTPLNAAEIQQLSAYLAAQ
jgi:cytochrome c553